MKFLRIIDKVFPPQAAYAHCDVPCGIYDPKAAQVAAATVAKMVEKLEGAPKSNLSLNDRNLIVRSIATKEVHAQKCKDELLILWTDFFKLEHLEKFPNLHETFWKTAKLCSQNKQDVDSKAASDLVAAVNEIADMFNQVKAAK